MDWEVFFTVSFCIVEDLGESRAIPGVFIKYSDSSCGLLLSANEYVSIVVARSDGDSYTEIYTYLPEYYEEKPKISLRNPWTLVIEMHEPVYTEKQVSEWDRYQIVYELEKAD